MGWFGKKAVGLQIDAYEARAVELSGRPEAARLIKYGALELPEGCVKDGVVQDPLKLGQSLSLLWDKCGIKIREAIISVSNQDVLVRFATFPRVPQDKLDNLIRFQAQDFLPMPVNTVVLDYIVLEGPESKESNTIEVLLVAARRSMLSGFIKAFEAAGITPSDIDVTSLSLLRMLPGEELKKGVAVVELGNELGNILLSVKGVPRLARLIPVSISDFLKEHMNWGGSGSFEIAKSRPEPHELDELGDVIAGGIQSSVNYYYVQSSSETIAKVLLCGRGIKVPGLLDKLKNSFDMPVEVLNPMSNIQVSKECAGMEEIDASDYAISISMALRGLEG